MERLSDRKIFLILFFLGFLIRLAYVLTLESHFYFDDEYEYYRMVENFLAGKGLIAGEHIKGFRPPLYPLLLSILYFLKFNLTAIRIFQCVISAFTVSFIYLTGKNIFSRKIGLWSGLVASIYPFFIFYNGFLLTETLFVFLTVVTIYSFVAMSPKFLSLAKTGVFLGLTGLCRPTMQMYLPISFIHIIAEKTGLYARMKKILIITVFFIATIGPLVIRNYVIFNTFVPGTTMGGWVFWEGNNPYSDGGPCHYFPENILKVDEIERDRILFQKTVEVIKKNPSRFVWLLQNKFKRFWNVVPNADEFTRPLYRIISVMSFGIMMPFFILGFLLSARNRKAQYMHSLIIFFTVFHMVFLASIRYRVTLEPFYIILAVYGFFWLVEKLQKVRIV